MNSVIFHRDMKLLEYEKELLRTNHMMERLRDSAECRRHWLDDHHITLCKYKNCNDAVFLTTLEYASADYFARRSRYGEGTLFDICVRKNLARFRSVFASPSTRITLQNYYDYAARLPLFLTAMHKPLLECTIDVDCYFRHYINLFMCYDMATSLVGNYQLATDQDQLRFLETIIDDILFLTSTVLSSATAQSRRN